MAKVTFRFMEEQLKRQTELPTWYNVAAALPGESVRMQTSAPQTKTELGYTDLLESLIAQDFSFIESFTRNIDAGDYFGQSLDSTASNSEYIESDNTGNTKVSTGERGIIKMDDGYKEIKDDLRELRREISDRDNRLQTDWQDREKRLHDEAREREERLRREAEAREERLLAIVQDSNKRIESHIQQLSTSFQTSLEKVEQSVNRAEARIDETAKHMQAMVTQNLWGRIATLVAILAICATVGATIWAGFRSTPSPAPQQTPTSTQPQK